MNARIVRILMVVVLALSALTFVAQASQPGVWVDSKVRLMSQPGGWVD